MKDDKGLLKIREAALLIGVNPETLRRWDREGILKSVRVGTRGDRRYKQKDVKAYINRKK